MTSLRNVVWATAWLGYPHGMFNDGFLQSLLDIIMVPAGYNIVLWSLTVLLHAKCTQCDLAVRNIIFAVRLENLMIYVVREAQ